MIKTLYHGTNTFFDEFKNEFLSTENSIDQYGSGFYFYEEASKTIMHGDLRVKAEVEILKSVEHTDEWYPTREDIYQLICASPNLEDRLWDFGDIDYDGFDTVLAKAVDCYENGGFYTDTLNKIGRDFFDNEDTHILLSEFVKLKGINCITDSKRGIYVILAKRFIEIKSVTHEQENQND